MADTQVHHRRVVVNVEQGLHIRPCTVLAQLAMQFRSRIRLLKGEISVDAKSILDLMTLAAGPGTVLDVEVQGDDAAEAIEKIAYLFETNFIQPTASPSQPSPV